MNNKPKNSANIKIERDLMYSNTTEEIDAFGNVIKTRPTQKQLENKRPQVVVRKRRIRY